jgi:hypothetical protein
LSDAATFGIVTELGNRTTPPTVGSFTFTAPAATTNYAFALEGTLNSLTETGTYTAPISNVASCTFNIAESTTALETLPRINGAIPGSITRTGASAGTGNFGNYPLYIGRRGGTTLPFNGRIYSFLVLGRTATATEITNTETWISNEMGGGYVP